MNSSRLLAITFLLAAPYMYAMEIETDNTPAKASDNFEQLDKVYATARAYNDQTYATARKYNDQTYNPVTAYHAEIEKQDKSKRVNEWNAGSPTTVNITKWKTDHQSVWAIDTAPNAAAFGGNYGHAGLVRINLTKVPDTLGWDTGSRISVVNYSPHKDTLTIGHRDGLCQIHDATTDDYQLIIEWNAGFSISALGYTTDSNYVATKDQNGNVRIFHILPMLAAHACKKKLFSKLSLLLKKLKEKK